MLQNLKIILIAATAALVSAYAVDHANNIKLDTSQKNVASLNKKIAELQKENAQLISLLNNKKTFKRQFSAQLSKHNFHLLLIPSQQNNSTRLLLQSNYKMTSYSILQKTSANG